MAEQLVRAIADLNEKEAVALTRSLLEQGLSPLEVLDDCRAAMQIVGERFERKEAFIPELIFAGEILKQITEIVKPYLQREATAGKKLGKVIIGTVQGDIHDIGKNIVVFMLEINGFDVTDLGVDVPAERFVEAARQNGAGIVGLSGFLTVAYEPMKQTVRALRSAVPGVKIMIGGGPINEQIREYTGADAWGKSAVDAVVIAKEWVGA
ncbi:MAG: cobalamin B12-binding domain-containing protein [Anaerolineae bacterium]